MGIKHLNKYLKDNCPKSIHCIHLSELSGKKIVIDTSIYLYKYSGDECLIENFYLMISLFRYYNITPIFIFDGKPPNEKNDLLKQRRENKLSAESEYKLLEQSLSNNMCYSDKQKITSTMDTLKKQFIYITKYQIDKIKQLIGGLGVSYYDAVGEADELCAMLVIKKIVYACLSEDMDMFAYGCTRVLRYLSLTNRNVVIYDLKNCLQELQMSIKEFRQICVLCGTDYDIDNTNDLYKIVKLFKKYKKDLKNNSDFYEWIKFNYIENIDNLSSIYKLFDLINSNINLKLYSKNLKNGQISNEILIPILEEDGFIFP